MTTPKDKITFETIKSSALDQVSKLGNSILNTATEMLTTAKDKLISTVDGVIDGIKNLIGTVKGAVDSAILAASGGIENILDPDADKILSVIPIPTIPGLPDFGGATLADAKGIFVSTLARVKDLGADAQAQITEFFSSMTEEVDTESDEPTTLVDNASEIIEGAPIHNVEVKTNNQGIKNVIQLKEVKQNPDVGQQIETYNKLSANTVGEKLYVRADLKAKLAGSAMYKEAIDSAYIDPVSDLVGLATLGHTLDTPALDPEDWDDVFISTNSNDSDARLLEGPARFNPRTSEYKLKKYVAKNSQAAYQKINKKMYYNLFKDRYWTNTEYFFDHPIARFAEKNKYGLHTSTASYINMGDYSSVGFMREINDLITETSELGVNPELLPLIGYLNNVNNYNKITEIPSYDIEIQGVMITTDTRGTRTLLPANSVDNTAVKINE